jgi:ankyrin repeat protein
MKATPSGSPVLNAAACDDLELATLLLLHGADSNKKADGTSPLLNAVQNLNFDLAKLLASSCAVVNIRNKKQGVTALNSAVEGHSNTRMV